MVAPTFATARYVFTACMPGARPLATVPLRAGAPAEALPARDGRLPFGRDVVRARTRFESLFLLAVGMWGGCLDNVKVKVQRSKGKSLTLCPLPRLSG